jgi:hypothetical protein
MIKGLILTAVGAGVSLYFVFVMFYQLRPPGTPNDAVLLIASLIFGISIAVLALGVTLMNKSQKESTGSIRNT